MNSSQSNNDADKKPIPKNEISKELKTCLWNVIYTNIEKCLDHHFSYLGMTKWSDDARNIVEKCWNDFFKLLAHEISDNPTKFLKEDFYLNYSKMTSRKTYEFLEFLANVLDNVKIARTFRNACNCILERENSVYRFVDKKIVEIVPAHQIQSIEAALNTSFNDVNNHINAALHLMSDKKNHNYRNSIKESISAIEALVRIIQKDSKKTLPDLLKQRKMNLHKALQDGLNKIYAYTSDDGGIRHSLTENSHVVAHSDALFMVVICSAFVNYIIIQNKDLNDSVKE